MLKSSASLAEPDPSSTDVSAHESTPPAEAHPLLHIDRIVTRICAAGALPRRIEGFAAGMTCAALIRASLVQSLYSFPRSDQLMEQLRYNALYRWFVGLKRGEPTWDGADYVRALTLLRASERGGPVLKEALSQAHAFAALTPGRFRIDTALLEAWSIASCDGAARSSAPGCCRAATSEDLSVSRLERAQAVILRRIGDPSLGPDEVAAELCMSRRALYLLFEKYGMTPTRAIREIRLESCRRVLGDARHLHRKITDVAMDFGFDDPASFSRQFKLRYGLSPREARFVRRPVPDLPERTARYRMSMQRACATT